MTKHRWYLLIEAWLTWQRAGSVSPNTLSLRSYQLRRFAHDHEHRNPLQLDVSDLAAWLGSFGWGPETLRSYRAALRSFYGWAHAEGRTATDPSRLLRKVKPSPAHPRPAPERDITDALHKATEREYLMLMLGSRHGLRRAEIAKVHSSDVIEEWSGSSLIVHGKGNKKRTIPLLDEVAALIRNTPDGPIFPNGKGSHLSPAHVGVLLRRLMVAGVTPHMLRHRFASRAYQATKDIRAVQELLGHASVATTQRYTAVADGALRVVLQAAA